MEGEAPGEAAESAARLRPPGDRVLEVSHAAGGSHGGTDPQDKFDRLVDEFVEGQIVRIEDTKWGNRLSTKLFVAKAFVEKHIRNKHAHVVEAERERLLDAVYFENFKAFRAKQRDREEEGQGVVCLDRA